MAETRAAVRRNESAQRYELEQDGEAAGHIDYREDGGTLRLVHTEVDPRFEGRGLAAELAKFALDDARARQLKVVPSCSYIAKYLQRHPGYEDLLA